MSNDQAAFHADQLLIEQRIDDILRAAVTRPLTRDEVIDLRLMTGVIERKIINHSQEEIAWA
jgi:hypothetical protein